LDSIRRSSVGPEATVMTDRYSEDELRSSARALRGLLASEAYQNLVERLNRITEPRAQQAFIEQNMNREALRELGLEVPESFSVSMRVFEDPRGSDGRGYVGHSGLPEVFQFFDGADHLGDSVTVCTTICHTAGGVTIGQTHGTTTGTPDITVVQ
jgi:hypothetical protein